MSDSDSPDYVHLKNEMARLLSGLRLEKVLRLENNELVLEFEQNTKLFIRSSAVLDISIT